MKIGNSVIQFKTTSIRKRNGEYYTMNEIPLWRCYARKGDHLIPDRGEYSFGKVLTYQQIVKYLQNTPYHHVLEAYPRFSDNKRTVFRYEYDTLTELFLVRNTHTGEILCEIDANTAQTKYLCGNYKSDRLFRCKFFEKTADNGLEYTYMAARMMKNEW